MASTSCGGQPFGRAPPLQPSFELTFLGRSDTYGEQDDERLPVYNPADYPSNVRSGSLRLVADPIIGGATKLTLRSIYTARNITRLRLYVHSRYCLWAAGSGTA